MEWYDATVNLLRVFALLVGSFVIFAGIVLAAREARGAGGRSRVVNQIGTHTALGLEFFVGPPSLTSYSTRRGQR